MNFVPSSLRNSLSHWCKWEAREHKVLNDRDTRGQLEPWRAIFSDDLQSFYSNSILVLLSSVQQDQCLPGFLQPQLTKIVVTSSQFHFTYNSTCLTFSPYPNVHTSQREYDVLSSTRDPTYLISLQSSSTVKFSLVMNHNVLSFHSHPFPLNTLIL